MTPPSTVLYAHGFEPGTVPAKAAGVTAAWSSTKTSVTPTGNRSFRGDFGNQTVSLTLGRLPAHEALTVSFDVYVIRSWDGSDTLNKYGPDTFSASLGDRTLVSTSFSNHQTSSPGSRNDRQGYDGYGETAGEFAAFAGASEVNTLGYDFFRNSTQQVEQMSSVYRISTTVPHSAAGAVLRFTGSGLQALKDESWGIDNVRVADGSTGVALTNAAGVEASLKVAKWENAFDKKVFEDPRVKTPDASNADFVDRDPDRFYVRVYDHARWNQLDPNGNPVVRQLTATLSTSNVAGFEDYDDPSTVIPVVRIPDQPGLYLSDSQLLVSNRVDDVFDAGLPHMGQDDAGPSAATYVKGGLTFPVSDRTHRIALGGTVASGYTAGGDAFTATSTVRVNKVVKVHMSILRLNANPANPQADDGVISRASGLQFLHAANEQYAQVGIRLIPNVQTVDPPTGVQLGDGLANHEVDQFDENGKKVLTAEQQLLLGHAATRTEATDDIELYVINFFPFDSSGESFTAETVPDNKYVDSAIVSHQQGRLFTIPHEIGHVLAGRGGHKPLFSANLMRGGGTSEADELIASKRLDREQETLFTTARPNLLGAP